MNDRALEQKVLLRHLSGSKKNQSNFFKAKNFEELSFGRDDGADIQYDQEKDDLVDRRHAVIYSENDNRFFIKDEESQNGTFVNQQRIFENTPLCHGDIVQLGPGGPEFRFVLDPPPDAAPFIESTSGGRSIPIVSRRLWRGLLILFVFISAALILLLTNNIKFSDKSPIEELIHRVKDLEHPVQELKKPTRDLIQLFQVQNNRVQEQNSSDQEQKQPVRGLIQTVQEQENPDEEKKQPVRGLIQPVQEQENPAQEQKQTFQEQKEDKKTDRGFTATINYKQGGNISESLNISEHAKSKAAPVKTLANDNSLGNKGKNTSKMATPEKESKMDSSNYTKKDSDKKKPETNPVRPVPKADRSARRQILIPSVEAVAEKETRIEETQKTGQNQPPRKSITNSKGISNEWIIHK